VFHKISSLLIDFYKYLLPFLVSDNLLWEKRGVALTLKWWTTGHLFATKKNFLVFTGTLIETSSLTYLHKDLVPVGTGT